jgi:hypothetical protein
MVGQRVVVVRNLKSRKVAGFASNGMVLCATGADGRVEFVVPPAGAKEGERVTFEGHGGAAAEPNRVDKKKVRRGGGSFFLSLSLLSSLALAFTHFAHRSHPLSSKVGQSRRRPPAQCGER